MALALYRKYRPRTFAEIIGQEHVTEPLSQALRSGRLHHAYLFSGPRGCGKTSSARILARSLNCEQGPTPEPCGVCASCRSLMNDGAGSIDVIEIDAASHGGVDDARDLREKAFFAPASSRYKIYVIDEAHMVSSAGFNALLKLVEEPPDYVKFIFATTEPEKVLGTIRSRTHHYPFRLIPPAVLRPYLQQLTEAEGIHVEPAVLPLVVRAGGGSARDSLSVLDQLIAGAGPAGVSYARAVALLGVTDVALIDEMCDALAAADGAAAYQTINRVAEAGHDARRFASDLLERFRDLIILQQVPDAITKGLIDGPADQLDAMGAQATRLGPATLSRCADIVHNGLVEMRGTTAPRLLLELITARMLLPGAEDSTGALLQRLERMERRLTLGGSGAEVADVPLEPVDGGAGGGMSARSGVAAPPPGGTMTASGGATPGGGGISAARAAAASAARRAPAARGSSGSSGPASDAVVAAVEAASGGRAVFDDAAPAGGAVASHDAASVVGMAASDEAVPAVEGTASQDAASAVGGAASGDAVSTRGGAARGGAAPAVGEAVGGRGAPAVGEAARDDAVSAAEQAAPGDAVSAVDAVAGGADVAGGVGAKSGGRSDSGGAGSTAGSGLAERERASASDPVREPTMAATTEVLPADARFGRSDSGTEVPAGGYDAPPQARRPEPAGILPDAPDEPVAAPVSGDGLGELTAAAVREVWPEIITGVSRRSKKIAALASGATVRDLDGQTVVLTFRFPAHAKMVAAQPGLITDALYEALGGHWQIRCDVAGDVGGPALGAPAQAGPRGGGTGPTRPASPGPATEGRTAAATAVRSAATNSGVARQRSASAPVASAPAVPDDDDDDWPEPVKPGGAPPVRAPGAPSAATGERGRPDGRDRHGDGNGTRGAGKGLNGGTGASGGNGPTGAAKGPDGGSGPGDGNGPGGAESGLDGGSGPGGGNGPGGVESGLDSGTGPSGGSDDPGASSDGPRGDGSGGGTGDYHGPGGDTGSIRNGDSGAASDPGRAGSGDPGRAGSGDPGRAGNGDSSSARDGYRDAGSSRPNGSGTGVASGGTTDISSGGIGPAVRGGRTGAASQTTQGRGAGETVAYASAAPEPTGRRAGEAGGWAIDGSGTAGRVTAQTSPGTVWTPSLSSDPGAAASPVPGSPAQRTVNGAAHGAAAGGPSRTAVNAAPGSGLAAARAAAARTNVAKQADARPAAWADGSPTEEAPYDPEYDGPPRAADVRGDGAGFEGFDPGDEPLDEVIDERAARRSSEQQAMQLLKDMFGAERISEL